MGRTVNPLLRLRRFESFSLHTNIVSLQFKSILEVVNKSGSSSVGRAIAFQAIGREFEPRLPLQIFKVFQSLSFMVQMCKVEA